jgi:hypothetical protein
MPFMYCDSASKIVQIHAATSEAHVGHGSVLLASGASFEIP